jgi:hypothetical protein
MPQMSERTAEALSPQQATALVHVLDLQARWENHRDDPAKSAGTFTDLQARQKAFEAFQVAWRNYAAKYRNACSPETTQNVPDRLAIWCRVLRTVFQRAETGNPTHAMAKVYRLADRIAARLQHDPLPRTPAETLTDAVQQLNAVIAWCEAQPTTSVPVKLLPLKKDEAA